MSSISPNLERFSSFAESEDQLLRRSAQEYAPYATLVGGEASSRKRSLLHGYDVRGMRKALALCAAGRSGSLLLASYLDGHPDLITLPMMTGEPIYRFLSQYEHLSIWEKLIIYPEYSGLMESEVGEFAIQRQSVIKRGDYYAAVHALLNEYENQPVEWINSRAAFFQCLHVAYALASGREASNPRPLVVFAFHLKSQYQAELFAADFDMIKFVHTVRDPISSANSWFDRQVYLDIENFDRSPINKRRPIDAAAASFMCLLSWSYSHVGMEVITRAVRFEDMHCQPEILMRRLAAWLELPFHECLIASTWNGVPYLAEVRGVKIVGANPANAARRWNNLGPFERLLIFAMMRDDFLMWDYPFPPKLQSRIIRLVVIALCIGFPMKLELLNARENWRFDAVRNPRRNRLSRFARIAAFGLWRYMRIRLFLMIEAMVRLSGKRSPFQLV
jgi:hypothetical protein